MNAYTIIAQAIGIVAMAFNILSYQQKTAKGAIAFQLFGCTLFAVNFFMLGAIVGGIMNLLGAFRAIVFMKKDTFRAHHIGWMVFFVGMYIASYVLTFTLLGKPFTVTNSILELLPVIAMTASTISFRLGNAKVIRLFGLISSPTWLVYNIANGSIGAIVCEVVSLGSIGVGMLRYDRKGKGEQ